MNDNDYHKELLRCVKCGACKTNCPTYGEERDEAASARGKIALLKALEKGVISPNHPLVEKLYCCTMCGACERSCSPGIDISGLFYYALNKFGQKYRKARVLGDIAKVLMPRKETALALARGLQSMSHPLVLKKSSLYCPPSLASITFVTDKDLIIAHRRNKKQGTVAVFAGCNVNYFYPQQGEALVNILSMSGYDVVVAKEQLCCGTPLRSLGLENEAREYALKNTELFKSLNVEAVITLCPSCSQMLTKGYQSLVDRKIENVVDASSFIVQRGIGTDNISLMKSKKIVYHDPCHLIYGSHGKEEPRKILGSINNVHLLESDNNSICCGLGGIFRYNFPDISIKIGQKRFENLAGSGADTIATACPGCVMQFHDSAKRNNSDIQVRNVVEILWEAMKEKE